MLEFLLGFITCAFIVLALYVGSEYIRFQRDLHGVGGPLSIIASGQSQGKPGERSLAWRLTAERYSMQEKQ